MNKRKKIKRESLTTNLCLSEGEKSSLKGKKVMLPRDDEANNRYAHSIDVKNAADKIFKHLMVYYADDKFIKDLNKNKLLTMCRFHDIGHCPYGHAGEDKLNSLISEDDGNYRDSFYSGYKHNLLSAKLLLDKKINISWDILDGIIKHSKTYPSNFNLSRVSDNNLLKLNYIFNCDKTRKKLDDNGNVILANMSWQQFVNELVTKFPCDICVLEKYDYYFNKKQKNICICNPEKDDKSCTYCVKKQDNKSAKVNITQYLLFPHPLTIEGEILKLADEISGLVRDMENYFKHLKKHSRDSEYQIIKAKVLNELSIQRAVIDAKYCKADKMAPAAKFIDLVYGLIDTARGADELIDFLICQIDYSSENFEVISNRNFNNKSLLVNWKQADDKFCVPLLKLELSVEKTFKKIKSCIYQIIHTDKDIKKNNKTGEENIQKTFNHYYQNPALFFEIKSHLPSELDNITEEIHSMSGKNIIEKIDYAKAHYTDKDNGEHYMKLLNSFRREIAFFIAEMTEQEIEDFVKDI